MTIFGTAMSRQAKENVCNAQSIPVRLHCPFENCHKSHNSKKHINEHFLSTAMDRHVLNSKQHLRPRAVVGYGVKIFGRGLFMTSPDHLVGTIPPRQTEKREKRSGFLFRENQCGGFYLRSVNVLSCMHPRNVYRKSPPDFKILAETFEYFRPFVKESSSEHSTLEIPVPCTP